MRGCPLRSRTLGARVLDDLTSLPGRAMIAGLEDGFEDPDETTDGTTRPVFCDGGAFDGIDRSDPAYIDAPLGGDGSKQAG